MLSKGPPIGLFNEIEYSEDSITLNPQDRIVIVTDGLYEFSTSKDHIYGWDRMVEWFEANKKEASEIIWHEFHDLIVESRAKLGIQQEDDETLLILTRDAE